MPANARNGGIDVVAIAASAGGIEAVAAVLRTLGPDFPAAVVVAMHLPSSSAVRLETFRNCSKSPVGFVASGERIEPGRVHVAPPGHAIELEPDGTATIVAHPNARYPLDATLESIAVSYGQRALAVILTGMRDDGADGVRAIKEHGGLVIVQSPDTSQHPNMPEAAIATGVVDLVLPLGDIGRTLHTVIASGTLPAPRQRVAALDAVFGGTGEMRAYYRTVDWEAGPLGPVETWPPELTAFVRLAMTSSLPIILSWGRQHVSFVNDASMPLIGGRAFQTGRPAAIVWPELGDAFVAELDGVLQGGKCVEHRSFGYFFEEGGRLVEHFFDLTRVPILDRAGAQGIFQPFLEVTARVLAERRMATLARLAAVPRSRLVNDAYTALLEALDDNRFDVPFALAYAIDGRAAQGILRASVHVPDGSDLAPNVVELRGGRAPWPLATVVESRKPLVVTDLASRFDARILDPWGEPTTEAMIVPLAELAEGAPLGALVIGLNRRQPLDDAYRTFIELLAAQIGGGVIEARAFATSQQRADGLADANRAKTEFFSNVSHEFRTPLTLILGPLERARAVDGLPAEVIADLDVAERNARRLIALVSTLLDVAQADAHRLAPQLELTDLARETELLAGMFRAAIEHVGIRFTVECELGRPVAVDRSMWAKIVVNLLANALKFTFEGEINVVLRERAQHAELVVSDTGVGISAAERPHVFERFFRAQGQRARTHEGSGIGLALVKELAKVHHGRVRVQGSEGHGSTFTVWIPILPPGPRTARLAEGASAPEEARAIAEDALTWSGPTPATHVVDRTSTTLEGLDAVRRDTAGARVLVVDDNADMRAYLESVLGEAGWQIESAADGLSALAKLRARRPDLLVADVMMPGVDGFELLRRVRDDPELRTVPVVLVTARAAESAAVEGLMAGANDYLAKPFSPRELVARLGAQIELARVRGVADLAQRRLQAWVAAQNQAFQAAMNGAPLETSLGILVRAAVEQSESTRRCAFYVTSPDGRTLRHVVGMSETYAGAVDGREHGDRRCWSFPVETSTGKLVGSFAMYFTEPREPTANDRELAATLCPTAAIIMCRYQTSGALETQVDSPIGQLTPVPPRPQ